MTTMFNNNSN